MVGPRKEAGGLTWVRASKPFADPAEAERIVADLSGTTGPFHSFHVTRHRSLLRTTTRFTGDVDLSGGLQGFADPALRQRLGDAVPFDVEGLRRKLGDALNDVFKVQVVAALPGSVSSNAPGKASNGAVWHPKLGEHVHLVATSRSWDGRRIVFGALAIAFVIAAAAAAVLRRRHRRPTPASGDA